VPIQHPDISEKRPTDGDGLNSLRDLVLAILSMASVQGTNRVPLTEFYRAFADVAAKHGRVFPPMHFSKNPYSVYSKRLDEAVQSLVGYSISLPNPQLQYLEVKKAAAERHLSRLRDRYGSQAVKSLAPIVKEFLESIKKTGG
jgi:hypothetical protein